MNELLLILSTFPDLAKARQIGTLLVETQLAACVNLLPGAESLYRWEDQVETASEVMAVFKTSREMFPVFKAKLQELHPYEVPEIVALRPEDVAASYAGWLLNNVAVPGR